METGGDSWSSGVSGSCYPRPKDRPLTWDAGAAELAKMVVGRNYRALPMQPRMGNALRRPKRPPAVDTTKINTVTATGSSYGDGREEPVWRTSRPHEFAKRPC